MTRVLEIGQIVAGPTAGLILADLGFEVIKVERPGVGDISRRLTGPSTGAFPFYNRNKKSVTIDLSAEEGKKVFLKLAESSDIIVESLGYGAMERLGLSYEVVSKSNPRIVYLSIKGYGVGPYEKRKALDYPIEVHSGMAYMTGLSGRPMRVGGSVVDIGAAMFGVIEVLKALIDVAKTGRGRYIEVGLFETAVFFMGQHIATYQLTGRELKPINEEGFAWGVYDFFPTLDGERVFIAVATDTQWRDFCQALELGVCDDPSLSTNELRYQNRDLLYGLVSAKTSKMKKDELVGRLEHANVPFAVLNRPWDLLSDPHASIKMVTVEYENKKIRVPTTPTSRPPHKNPPRLGEDTAEVLKSLGYSQEDIVKLKKQGVI